MIVWNVKVYEARNAIHVSRTGILKHPLVFPAISCQKFRRCTRWQMAGIFLSLICSRWALLALTHNFVRQRWIFIMYVCSVFLVKIADPEISSASHLRCFALLLKNTNRSQTVLAFHKNGGRDAFAVHYISRCHRVSHFSSSKVPLAWFFNQINIK